MEITNAKTICDRYGKEIKSLMPRKAVHSISQARLRKATLQTQEAERFGYLCDVDLLNEELETVNAIFSYNSKVKTYDLCKDCGRELKKFLKNK